MTFAALLAHLESTLRGPLPGVRAHERMAPRPPRSWPAGSSPARVRTAAGLLLLMPVGDDAHLVLTVRAGTLGRHGGQVSLPGGVQEPGETIERTAVREAHEEVGLPVDQVRTIGVLTPVDIVVSGFRLYPVVASVTTPPRLRPTDGEVERILEIGVDQLMDPGCVVWRSRTRGLETVQYPAFSIGGVDVWGATAMVLAEFLTLAGWPGPAPRG